MPKIKSSQRTSLGITSKNMINIQQLKEKFSLHSFLLGLGLPLILGAVIFFGLNALPPNSLQQPENIAAAQAVDAATIYPLFLCPCCGNPLDPKNICCPMAEERINYIDTLVAKKLSEKEVVLAYTKKYGSNSFVDAKKAEEFREELAAAAPSERPIISLEPLSKNLGDVSQKGGVVATFFPLKNEGEKDLIINKLDTSCGCTSAAVVFQEKEGPRFAMEGHGAQNPTDWQLVIPPGEIAQLKVYYDPNIHKDFRGFAIREIYVSSNDPIDFEKKVKIELNQVD